MAFCEGSANYPFLIAPKPFGHSLMSKSLPHAKIQLYLRSQSSSANFQTFCQTEGIVKEVLARCTQMSWNFAHSFMFSYYHTPPNFSSIPWSMWAQDQIFDSANIFRLWSKYNFYCFINSDKLPGHASIYINSSHTVLPQLVYPIVLYIFFQVSV